MVPNWIKDAIFYQIFPDRFANGDRSNDPANVQPWGSKPTNKGFQGGDLKGILDHFDYLLDLGINAIYLNPIFQATSNHRYNTTDYFKIDSKLGSNKDFRAFLDYAHGRDVRVILDGVFNHCGRSFFAFQDLLENEHHSAYQDWFHIHRFPLEAYGVDNAENYRGWWDFKSLPKFNTDNPEVREYLFGVAKYWIDQGIDGWRLDVPNEIDDDSFWAEFRHVVKGANPEAYLVGEIWEADPRWVGDGHFDGLMCYPLRDLLLDLIIERKITASTFASAVEDLFNLYPPGHYFAQLLTLGSHDTKRLLTVCKGNRHVVQLICTIQFCMPGAPHIYYGDEIGVKGGKDPDCRKAFPWDEGEWDREHLEFMRKLIDIRIRFPQLRGGVFHRIAENDKEGVIAFTRTLEGQAALIIANTKNSTARISLSPDELPFPKGIELQDLLNGSQVQVGEAAIEFALNPLKGVIIVPKA
jgi:cyclomaltodextrinase